MYAIRSYYDMPYHKEFSNAELEYAASDVIVLHPLCDILAQQMEQEGLIDTALLEFEFLIPCSEIVITSYSIHYTKLYEGTALR